MEAVKRPRKAFNNLYPKLQGSKKPKFKPGDFVRISKYRNKFKRGYTANFTSEAFVVTDVLKTNPITYKVAEIRNAEKIIGTFYEQELSLFKPTKAEQLLQNN